MVAITQVRNPNSPGRAYFDRKLAEAKTKKEALRALKRRSPTSSTASSSPTRLSWTREGNWHVP